MSACERGACDWTHWAGHLHVKDMLARACRTCGERQIRVLPMDVERPGPGQGEADLVWNGTREEGE